DSHRLLRMTDRAGLTWVYHYDRGGRCHEAYGTYLDRPDPALSPDVPSTLDDGSPAKGIYHVRIDYLPGGYRVATVSDTKRDYLGNDRGLVDRRVEGGAIESFDYDAAGNLLARTDGLEQ